MASVKRSPSMARGFEWLALCASLAAGEWCAFASSFLSPLWPLAAFAALAALVACVAFPFRLSRLAAVFAAGFALALHSAQSRRDVLEEAHVLGCGRPFVRMRFSSSGRKRGIREAAHCQSCSERRMPETVAAKCVSR